jgi:hypothetical protein
MDILLLHYFVRSDRYLCEVCLRWKLISRCYVVLVSDPLCIPMVLDICVLQPPIDTSGETTSASQVFPKGQ